MRTIALTPGCPTGIGPELFPFAIAMAQVPNNVRFIWCGSAELLMKHAPGAYRKGQDVELAGHTIRCELADQDEANVSALDSQRRAIDLAIRLALDGKVQGIVTGPIRKAALANVNGRSFDGQTEYLHHFLAADERPPLMCFAGADFLLGLCTIHVPLKDVSARITDELVSSQVRRLHEAASDYFNISTPNITVLGLNPHAGEHGLIGQEEVKVIPPALNELRKVGFDLNGPVPADGFFGSLDSGEAKPHAVLAMYHDQGLAPYKLLSKGASVNMTIGLTIRRTSPAHGTADILVGTGKASPASLAKAIEVCAS